MATPPGQPVQVPQPAGSPAGSAQDIPVPEITAQEEYDLFGPPDPANPFATGSPTGSPTGPGFAKASPPTVPAATATPFPNGVDQAVLLALLRTQQDMLRHQQDMLRQNQQLMSRMAQRMEREDQLREEERAERAALKAAEEASKRVSLDPFSGTAGAETPAASSSSVAVPTYSGGNRAEKYLPPLPTIQHAEMGKNRVREVGEWHRFLEVFMSWLALTDEAYVSEMRHCLKHPHVIEQGKLSYHVAARSATLFYYLGLSAGTTSWYSVIVLSSGTK